MLTLWGLYPIITLASDRDDKHNRIPGCGSAWLERLVWDQEVAGSNPVASILGRGAGILSLRVSVIFLCKTKNFAMGYENKNKSI